MATVNLDIVSDVVCPWCWLGKKRLEAARALRPDLALEIRWRPFQLDPGVPSEGVPYADYMAAKAQASGAAGPERFAAMREHLLAAAPEAGIRFRFDEIAHRPNTLNAHRLIRWAEGQGEGGAAAEALFRAFFDELRDVGDAATLADIAVSIGLDGALTAELLAGEADRDAVQAEEAMFRRLGVTSVPTFIAEGRIALPGAQEPEAMAAFLDEAAALAAQTPAAP